MARKTIGNAVTFVRRHRQNIAERKPEVPDAKSLAQLSWRHMYLKVVALWHSLTPAEKADWESLARRHHLTGYQWFISQALKPNPGIYLPLQGGTMSGDIDMAKYRLLRLPVPLDAQEALRLSEYTAAIAPYLYHEGARVYHNANQSIPHDTETVLAFNSEAYDTDTIHSTIVNNSRLTCKTAGKYLIVFQGYFALGDVTRRHAAIWLNRATNLCWLRQTSDANENHFFAFSTIATLALTDYVEIFVYQFTGGPLNFMASGIHSPAFMMQRIGA